MTRRRAVAVACLLLLVAGAGCQGVKAPPSDPEPPVHPDRPDPEDDVIGWEDGVWHNESVAVNQSDGLNDTETRTYVARSMARVEVIRGREFTSRVPVEVISRAAYRNRSGTGGTDSAYGRWNNQVWEAMFVVGEDADVQQLLSSTLSNSVLGFYSPAENRIKIITPTPEQPTISNSTLIHELTHALQDQYHDLGAPRYSARTQDGDLAIRSVIEGEARWVEHAYRTRCGDTWNCVASPAGGGGGGGAPANWGLSITLYFPYSDGPVYVDRLYQSGGWDAVAAAMADPPESTEQVIHHTDDAPVNVTVADAAAGGWERFPEQGVGGADTLGEASIYVSFWYQSQQYGAGVIDPSSIAASGPLDAYDYRSAPSTGWDGGAVVPYRNGDRYGYVWKTAWDSPADARQFARAYRTVLRAHDATDLGGDRWRIDSGPFADAFRVAVSGDTVTIVNAPTADALDAVHAPSADATPTPSATATTTDRSGSPVPGFGVGAALAALLAASAAGLRRR